MIRSFEIVEMIAEIGIDGAGATIRRKSTMTTSPSFPRKKRKPRFSSDAAIGIDYELKTMTWAHPFSTLSSTSISHHPKRLLKHLLCLCRDGRLEHLCRLSTRPRRKRFHFFRQFLLTSMEASTKR